MEYAGCPLAIAPVRPIVWPSFFDWLHTNHPAVDRCRSSGLWSSATPFYGGVLDSTLGWSAPLPVESRGSLVKPPAKKTNGNTEEMPLAA